MMYKVFNHKLELLQLFQCPMEFDRLNLTALKNRFKIAQKVNVEPYMATYWFNSMMYKFFNHNLRLVTTISVSG